MKLLWKFNLVFVVVFAAGMLASALLSWQLLSHNARQEALANGVLWMDKAAAVKRYTSGQVLPLLNEQMKHTFLPQSVAAYSATEILNDLRGKYPDFYYKEAVLNPSNPRDRPDPWESEVVEKFRGSSELAEVIGERNTSNGRTLYIARPIRITDDRCLGCHSTVQAAPKAVLDRYGTVNGLGWKLNEVIGAQFVSVPTALPLARAEQTFRALMIALAALFIVVAVVLNVMLRALVIHPIDRYSSLAEEARRRAEHADRAKTTFIAAVSHDLRQPLHALVQYVSHLRRITRDPQAGPTLTRIDESVQAMSGLLNAVLDFSKISMGSITPSITTLDVADVLARLETQIRPDAQAKGLCLRIDCRGGLVRSDAALLDRILSNLAHNAIRYTHTGAIVIRAVARGDVVRILVSDSGIGIEPTEKARIFEAYYQVNNHARDRRKGLGLGLAVVRDLAALLGLRVRVKSAIGRGSTFAVDLPRAPASRQPLAVTDRDVPDLVRGAFIALIDDDDAGREAMSTTLKDMGCRVVAGDSAETVLGLLANAEFAPQLLISDYRLRRGTNGLEAIATISARHRDTFGDEFPLAAIVISGDTSTAELERVASAGYPMLHKPVGFDDLHAALNAALSTLGRGRDVQ